METEPDSVKVPSLEQICREVWEASIIGNEYLWHALAPGRREHVTRVLATALHAGRSLEWKYLPSHDIVTKSIAHAVICLREGDAASRKMRPLEGYDILDVLQAIKSERDYQGKKWPGHSHTTAEWVMIMRKCLKDAEHAWHAGHGNDNEVLNEIRQVTAVGVAAMEEHGAPLRPPFRAPEQKKKAGLETMTKEQLIDYIRRNLPGWRSAGVGQ